MSVAVAPRDRQQPVRGVLGGGFRPRFKGSGLEEITFPNANLKTPRLPISRSRASEVEGLAGERRREPYRERLVIMSSIRLEPRPAQSRQGRGHLNIRLEPTSAQSPAEAEAIRQHLKRRAGAHLAEAGSLAPLGHRRLRAFDLKTGDPASSAFGMGG